MLLTSPNLDFLEMRRKEIHLQHLSPSRQESHQARAPSKGQVQSDHNREDRRNRVKDPQGRVQSQGKDPLDKDLDKAKDHQARGPDQARVLLAKVLLAKDPLARLPDKVRDHQAKDSQGSKPPNQVKDHQVQVPNRVAPHRKELGSLNPKSKDHKAQQHINGSQLKVVDPLVSRGQESPGVDSVHCVRPPS